MSAHVCGCNPEEHNYHCEDWPNCTWGEFEKAYILQRPEGHIPASVPSPSMAPVLSQGLFPDSAAGRKAHPIFTGFLMYFPDAIAAIARVSQKGNDQHNPGEPLHWARGKSTDQMDTATRHMMDHGTGHTLDTDGEYHLAKAAWRICAELQLTIEKDKGRK